MNKLRRTLISALRLPRARLARAARPAPATRATASSSRRCRSKTPAKIEVVEFFWYGCIHCYNLEPLLEAWVPKLPPDVAVPPRPGGVQRAAWAHDAAIFYAFEALGVLDKLHRPLFDAIHQRPAAHRQPGGARRMAATRTAST